MAKASDLFDSGVTTHGGLTGLASDDHMQYHTDARGDVRYYLKATIDTALGLKANASHSHNFSSLSDVAISAVATGELIAWSGSAWINRTLAEAGIAAASHAHAWGDITGKPSSFSPSAHVHEIGDVTGLQAALDGKASSGHGHSLDNLSNVTITSVVAGEILTYSAGNWINQTLAEAGIAAASHSHTKASIGLGSVDNTTDAAKPISAATQAALDSKAASSHVHVINDVTGLQAALDGKSSASHGHTFASLTGKPTTLSGYGITDAAALSHGHAWGDITGKPSSFAPSAHGHPISDVAGLQAELDSKVKFNRVIVTGNYTAIAEQVIAVDTSNAAITITAPASPADNTYFYVGDAGASAETNNITVTFNGENYNGSIQPFVIDVTEFGTGFLFVGNTWRMVR